MVSIKLDPSIFKAYDIRGIYQKNLTKDIAFEIGKSIASEAIEKNVDVIAVGRDGRLSGLDLVEYLMAGIVESGINVIDVGMVATPMLYFAAIQHAKGSGVMITGSHNPPDYNGFKIMVAGTTYARDAIQELKNRIEKQQYHHKAKQTGMVEKLAIAPEYIAYITSHIHLQRKMKITIDAGNGVAGAFVGSLFEALGCEVTELFCEVDGHFPNHHPDPAKLENLQDLKNALLENDSEIGLAFDGDGDRLGVVTKEGKVIYPDRQLMLFAADVLERNPGAKVIYDVKSTRLLSPWIKQHGGIPIMSKTGHSFMKAAIKEHQALVAGEMSGHVFFKERWLGFDDGLYAAARLLEILSKTTHPSTILNDLPEGYSTPEINIDVPDDYSAHEIMDELVKVAHFDHAKDVITIDGLRVEFENGFGLIRASNTTPVLVLRFEGDNEEALNDIKSQFKALISQNSHLSWPD